MWQNPPYGEIPKTQITEGKFLTLGLCQNHTILGDHPFPRVFEADVVTWVGFEPMTLGL